MNAEQDVRDVIFRSVRDKKYRAVIIAEQPGVLSGMRYLEQACATLGIRLVKCKEDGKTVVQSEAIVVLEGTAKQVALAEEQLIGWISKASGIATAARKARAAAGRKINVVSGAWKKMPSPIKDLVRQAILDGGVQYRIADPPFVYLDKNYVKILGGVEKALQSVCARKGKGITTIVQLKSEGETLLMESVLAATMGASIIMIDTGRKENIEEIDLILRRERLRHKVKVAFGGSIKIEDLADLKKKPIEIVDIGRAIVDGPLLDLRLDVLREV